MARRKPEFKPDSRAGILKYVHLTRLQRLNLLKWAVYGVLCVLLLVLQDVIMSRISILGATTDLPAAIILLITVLVGSEYGGVFVLTASTIYWFSGSAPGPYSIGLLTFLGVFATLIRQVCWRRGLRSTVLCAGCALMLYEMIIYAIAVAMHLAPWTRIGAFALSGLFSWLLMIPLYPLTYKIGQIGGEPWKE